MARPRKWANDAERMAARRINEQSGRVNEQTDVNEHELARKRTMAETASAGFVRFRHQPHVPIALFTGRGTIRRHADGQGYVMVSRHAGSDLGELGVVTAADWQSRLSQRCDHGNAGWSCHTC